MLYKPNYKQSQNEENIFVNLTCINRTYVYVEQLCP